MVLVSYSWCTEIQLIFVLLIFTISNFLHTLLILVIICRFFFFWFLLSTHMASVYDLLVFSLLLFVGVCVPSREILT